MTTFNRPGANPDTNYAREVASAREREAILNRVKRNEHRQAQDILASLGVSRKEREQYSVVRAIQAMGMKQLNPMSSVCDETGLENEVSDAIARQFGVPPHGGRWIPMSIRGAGLDTKTDSAGAFTVTSRVVDMVEIVRARARVLQLGAEFLEFGPTHANSDSTRNQRGRMVG